MFDALIRTVLSSVADPLTASLQVTVSHQVLNAVSPRNKFLKPNYDAATSRQAIWQDEVRYLQTGDGSIRQSRGVLTFPRNVVVAVTDKFTLPDGTTGPILDIKGVADPAGGRYFTQVWLGYESS